MRLLAVHINLPCRREDFVCMTPKDNNHNDGISAWCYVSGVLAMLSRARMGFGVMLVGVGGGERRG